MAGRREQKAVKRGQEGAKDLPRRAAAVLARVLRFDGRSSNGCDGTDGVIDKGRQAFHRASSAVGSVTTDRGVDAMLRRADEAAEEADAAEAEAVAKAEEAKRAAD